MSRYVVRVVGPAGMETYLFRGREVGSQEQATQHAHPSNAWRAGRAYRQKRNGETFTYDVIDTSDPERVVRCDD